MVVFGVHMQKTFSKKDIAGIAQEVLKDLGQNKKGEKATVLTLSGNLGAGKTTFTQALAHEACIRGVFRDLHRMTLVGEDLGQQGADAHFVVNYKNRGHEFGNGAGLLG